MKKIFCIIILGITIACTSCEIIYQQFDCRSYVILGKVYSDCFGSAEKLTLPESVPRNVQELHMEAFDKSSIVIKNIDMFNRFANLSVLDIRTGKSFFIDENLQKPDQQERLRKNLFDLPNLEKLIIQYEEFNEENNSWVLPPKLKELHLHHSVFEFDIFPCTVLEILMFTNNKLKRIPRLRDPPPPLKVLSLSLGNSLDEFTVEDIAPLCKLQRLELVMHASGEESKKGCECYRLQEWITDLKLEAGKSEDEFSFSSEVYLYCPKNYAADCWNYTLDDARKKRDQCLWSNYGIIPKSVKRGLIVLLLVTVVIAVFMISYGLHCFGSRSKPRLAPQEKYFNCTPPFRKTFDDYEFTVVSCKSDSNETLPLPQNIYKKTNRLIINSSLYGALMIKDADTFKRFSNLEAIQFITRTGLEISKSLQHDEVEQLRYELFNVSTLSALVIDYIEFNSKNHQWILPKSLKIFRISNSVLEYDLSRCSQLESLFITRSKLNKMPILSNPSPPLINLDLSENPLREFGANDLAGFCNLRHFALVQADLEYCECVVLFEWIKRNFEVVEEFKFGGILECDFVDDSNCSNDPFKEAELLVGKCLYKGVWDVILHIISIIALIVVSISAGLMIVHSCIKLMKRNESSVE